jgi:hypothetical protein
MTTSVAELMSKLPKVAGTADDPRSVRQQQAREVLFRLPRFIRTVPAPELFERVKGAGLRESARAWHWEAGTRLWLGTTGVGKSTAAAWLFRRLVYMGVTGGGAAWEGAARMEWFKATDLASARREHPLGHGEAPEVRDAATASLLFLDDLGWEKDTSTVCDVLALRYEAQLPTIATSGKTRDELSAYYGAAVVRKLLQPLGPRTAAIVECFEVVS